MLGEVAPPRKQTGAKIGCFYRFSACRRKHQTLAAPSGNKRHCSIHTKTEWDTSSNFHQVGLNFCFHTERISPLESHLRKNSTQRSFNGGDFFPTLWRIGSATKQEQEACDKNACLASSSAPPVLSLTFYILCQIVSEQGYHEDTGLPARPTKLSLSTVIDTQATAATSKPITWLWTDSPALRSTNRAFSSQSGQTLSRDWIMLEPPAPLLPPVSSL